MGTTKADIREWLERGREKGATHVIVVCDTFDWDDYPVFVQPDQDAREVATSYDRRNMQKLMEVYRLDMDWDAQLNASRSFNY
jgi:hypothetical protein